MAGRRTLAVWLGNKLTSAIKSKLILVDFMKSTLGYNIKSQADMFSSGIDILLYENLSNGCKIWIISLWLSFWTCGYTSKRLDSSLRHFRVVSSAQLLCISYDTTVRAFSIAFVVHPTLDHRFQLCTKVGDMERFFSDNCRLIMNSARTIPPKFILRRMRLNDRFWCIYLTNLVNPLAWHVQWQGQSYLQSEQDYEGCWLEKIRN